MPAYRTTAPVHARDEVVVDLSDKIDALMSQSDISDLLSEEQETRLVEYVKTISTMSHDRISRRYDHWKEADRAHDVYVPPEATRFREKAVIADTRAVADTVLTYLMAALTGRNPMFMLEGENRTSRRASSILERVLHQHMRRSAGEARIAQLLLDSVRYGFAPTKVIWSADHNMNHIVNFDPRRVFPDPRVAWGDWEKMQFIVFSDYCSTSALMRSGLYPKIAKYPALREKMSSSFGWDSHQWAKEEGRGLNIDPQEPTTEGMSFFKTSNARVVDEAWIALAGYEIGVPQIGTIYLLVTILDEDAVIRCQLNPYGRLFPMVIGSLYNDRHKTYGQSLYDILLPLHDMATWLLRSRVDNVQAALNNLIFADPTQVNIGDLINRNPWGVVQTLPGTKPGDGVFIAQVPDVTAGHWGDIQAMAELKQRVSAASDAQQGIPSPGTPPSATEVQRLTQLGSQRLGVLARILSATTIRPAVRMMVGNIQDALAYEGSIRVDPNNMPGQLSPMVQDGYLDFSVQDLQGDIDYLVVDGTLPIEPSRNAETWLNMLQVINQTGLNMEYKAGQIAEEAIRAMGISDIEQFRISPEERQQGPSPSQQLALMEKARGASVKPAEEVQREVERGNLIPARG